MATGDQNDLISRLQKWMPQGWYPATTGTRIYAVMAGLASVLSSIFGMIAYARLQTRIATATDGFLDIISRDYLANNLPRIPGETDAAFSVRIRANIFLKANTRTNIQAYLQTITGYPVRMIEPWQPNDTFVWGRSFWGVDTTVNPGQWANGNQRYCGLIALTLPASGASGLSRSWWGQWFWNTVSSLAPAAGAWWLAFSGSNAEQLIYAAIIRLKVFGTSIYVKFVPAPAPSLAGTVLTDTFGNILVDPTTGRELTL